MIGLVVGACVEAALIGGGAGWLLSPTLEASIAIQAAWVLLAFLYVAARWTVLGREARRGARPRPRKWAVLRLLNAIVSPAVAVVGVMSGFLIVTGMIAPAEVSENLRAVPVAQTVAVFGIFAGWAVMHLGYADRYQHLNDKEIARAGSPSFAFPGDASASRVSFAYFAFTVGTSFATSDVNVLTPRARHIVTGHAVLSFAYNTAALAIAIGFLTSR
jgi:uncharacterized membrane protein